MSSKQAACLNCRRSKIKCRRDEGALNCDRCQNAGLECIIPEFHIGRQKGVKNKRSGLEKAIYQVEEAIKKRKTDTPTNRNTLAHLKKLLGETSQDQQSSPQSNFPSQPLATNGSVVGDIAGAPSDDQLALEDVENPLQLLARASDLRIASPQSLDNTASTPGSRVAVHGPGSFQDTHSFFLPMKANLDQGPHLDPIDVGLVTLAEAEMLLSYFHEKLAHTRWGLDPLVHTLPFIRNRSAFLFTTLLAMTSIFIPEAAAMAKRLLLHRRFLAEQIIVKKYRSVEIVLAFMTSIPWMPPGSQANDDDTSLYLATALFIALDLSLNKVITPSTSFTPEHIRQIPNADCLDARKALAMDGFEDVDIESDWGQRLLRRRERVWIALFVLERGVCLARGRSYCVPKTCLIQHCATWHDHIHSYAQDGPLVSMAVLRRDLDDLFADVRSRCDNYRMADNGSKVAEEIDWAIESFFDKWSQTWTSVIGDAVNRSLPPYVEILVTHTRLSTYSMLLNHPSAPPEVKRSFRASALSSALNVMRAAIQGESRLRSMPNNTTTMICFAASIALALSAPVANKSGNQNLAPSIRNLIEETATVLERIGSNPAHRNGSSVVYGRFLRVLVKQAPGADVQSYHANNNQAHVEYEAQNQGQTSQYAHYEAHVKQESTTSTSSAQQSSSHHPNTIPHPSPSPPSVPPFYRTPLDFSLMSYNEVNETVSNSNLFSTGMLDLAWEQGGMGAGANGNANSLMWTDWLNLPDFNFP